METGLRSTQRAPLSCITCYTRKVKCDKKLPCGQCIRRGTVATCRREKVKVKGQLVQAKADDSRAVASYQDLLLENLALKARLHTAPISTPTLASLPQDAGSSLEDDIFVLDDTVESFRGHLFEYLTHNHIPSTVASYDDVEFPTREQSERLVNQAEGRIAWVHFALHHPTFEREHQAFWDERESHTARLAHDPGWLATYFSVLSVSSRLDTESTVLTWSRLCWYSSTTKTPPNARASIAPREHGCGNGMIVPFSTWNRPTTFVFRA